MVTENAPLQAHLSESSTFPHEDQLRTGCHVSTVLLWSHPGLEKRTGSP